jgi:acyl-protein synthetase LuxE
MPLLFCILTPPPALAPHSSLVHMFETVRREFGSARSIFTGAVTDGAWTLNLDQTVAIFDEAVSANRPVTVLGTAFNFVHLLDYLSERNLCYRLPKGSRILETGGYKGRSRSLSKTELHALITKFLRIPATHIVTEYGMSELSSQAYDHTVSRSDFRVSGCEDEKPDATRNTQSAKHIFYFPPWARVQIISPETGREVGEGETGLIRVYDLANVRSVMAVQTDDLAVLRGYGFELVGRAVAAEPRGCSLMTVDNYVR